MQNSTNSEIEYKTSSFSKDSIRRLCVGVGEREGQIYVTNTKDSSVVVSFTSAEWGAFLAGVKCGEFDLDKSSSEI